MTQPNKEFTQIISHFLEPITSKGSQLLQSIKDHKDFNYIARSVDWVLCQQQEGIITLNKDYIDMKASEKMIAKQRRVKQKSEKLSNARQILLEMQMKLECLIDQLEDKNKWIDSSIAVIRKNKATAEEDIQILENQNKRLAKQILQTSKQEFKQSKISGEISPKDQLNMILQHYGCLESGFPKNKNEAMKMVSRLDVNLQKLQIEKLSQE